MSIDIIIHSARDAKGRLICCPEARILFSPNEGYDTDKLAALERELGPYIGERLNAALRKEDEA